MPWISQQNWNKKMQGNEVHSNKNNNDNRDQLTYEKARSVLYNTVVSLFSQWLSLLFLLHIFLFIPILSNTNSNLKWNRDFGLKMYSCWYGHRHKQKAPEKLTWQKWNDNGIFCEWFRFTKKYHFTGGLCAHRERASGKK